MVRLFQLIERLRDQSLPVLITGETGTGKELVARAIRNRSLRSEGPFQTVHCACLPSELFESELFGHEAGAFTGAEAAQPGLLEELDGGTLLFDEVGQLPLASQSKLLRVLESGTIRRLGSTASRSVDVRFLFTAGADLRRAVEVGGFRADLYYRLSAVEIGLPALRDRREDIGRLALHLLERHAARLDRPVSALEPEAVLLLEGRDWPGNVRELEALLLRAVLQLSFPARIPVQDLRALLPETSPAAPAAPAGDLLDRSLADRRRNLEREYLASLFLSLRGDTREMMRRLGVRSTKLYAWLRDLGLEIRELRKRL